MNKEKVIRIQEKWIVSSDVISLITIDQQKFLNVYTLSNNMLYKLASKISISHIIDIGMTDSYDTLVINGIKFRKSISEDNELFFLGSDVLYSDYTCYDYYGEPMYVYNSIMIYNEPKYHGEHNFAFIFNDKESHKCYSHVTHKNMININAIDLHHKLMDFIKDFEKSEIDFYKFDIISGLVKTVYEEKSIDDVIYNIDKKIIGELYYESNKINVFDIHYYNEDENIILLYRNFTFIFFRFDFLNMYGAYKIDYTKVNLKDI